MYALRDPVAGAFRAEMSDVLVITARVPGAYPTTNAVGADGRRGGRKSQAYVDLTDAVRKAAMLEMDRVDWETAEWYCAVDLTFYHSSARKIDAQNAGIAENNALTAAGVWVDDRLAEPVTFRTEYDPAGESRVVIIIRKRYAPLAPKASAIVLAARNLSRRLNAQEVAPEPSVRPAPKRMAYVNGRPVPVEEALREIRAGKLR